MNMQQRWRYVCLELDKEDVQERMMLKILKFWPVPRGCTVVKERVLKGAPRFVLKIAIKTLSACISMCVVYVLLLEVKAICGIM